MAICILNNIFRSKGNQAIKFGQVIEYNKKIFSFKNHSENEAGRLVPDPFSFCKKASYEVTLSLLSIYFESPQLNIQKSKLYKI